MNRSALAIPAVILLFLASSAGADDFYFKIPLDKLEITQGKLPPAAPDNIEETRDWRQNEDLATNFPYVILDIAGEAWVGADAAQPSAQVITVHTTGAADVTGRIFFANSTAPGMTVMTFRIPASAATSQAKDNFLQVKRAHYELLLQAGFPGAAWFRHQEREAAAAFGDKPGDVGLDSPTDNFDDSYELFSGGRAVSENLQLDRALPAANSSAKNVQSVDIKSIEGITVAPIDWKGKTKGLAPKLDVLATLIPADQHAIFLPSFGAMMALMDEAQSARMPIILRAMAQPQDAMTFERYERQLCVSMTALSRALGPQLVGSVAITGSDPDLSVGSDVAIIFDSKDPAALESLLRAQIELGRQTNPAAKAVSGQAGDITYNGVETPDHSICAFVGRFGSTVVLGNSPQQLKAIAAVQKVAQPSLATQPEYIFFRDRYRLGDSDETAFVVLSDATIRRWCGPRWRIGSSRRTRAAAVMSELQATWLDPLVHNSIKAGPIYSDLHLTDLGDLALSPGGVTSSIYGSLEMMTPIAELNLDTVTQAEADSYKRWRDGYEQNWRWAFDPIAVEFKVSPGKLAADLTVMPLIWGSDYREMVAMSQGVSFAADAGDPHDSLLHLIVAINHQASMFQQGENFVANMAPGIQANPFGWLGKSVSLYADDDPFWDELAKAAKPSEFMEGNLQRLPIALRADVSNGLKLTGFLVALRAFVEQTAPQMTVWENQTYKDHPYVKISPSEMAKGQMKEIANAAIYYAATGDSLLITPSEPLLKRAIDRQTGARPATQPWLGSSVALRAQAKLFDLLMESNRKDGEAFMQSLAWKNLPILNEWKRRFPDQDPEQIQERVWGARLLDPAGESYVWNDKWQTMESKNYGQPGEPKDGPLGNKGWSGAQRADFGLTFEEQGVRARGELDRTSPSR